MFEEGYTLAARTGMTKVIRVVLPGLVRLLGLSCVDCKSLKFIRVYFLKM